MQKTMTIGIAVAFALVAAVAPASAIGLLDAKDDKVAMASTDYIAGIGVFNSSCGIEGVVVPVGGACINISQGERYEIVIDDDLFPGDVQGSWRILVGETIGPSTGFCGSTTMDDPADVDGQLQVFVGSHPANPDLDCPSIGTTGSVAFNEQS